MPTLLLLFLGDEGIELFVMLFLLVSHVGYLILPRAHRMPRG